MAGEIKVNYDVIDQVIADIRQLAEETKQYQRIGVTLSKSRGSVASALTSSRRCVADFAILLEEVMTLTAQELETAEAKMHAADLQSAAQYAPQSVGTSVTGAVISGGGQSSGGGSGRSFGASGFTGGGGGHSF